MATSSLRKQDAAFQWDRPKPSRACLPGEGQSSVAETAKTAQTQKIAEKQSLGDGLRMRSQTAETGANCNIRPAKPRESTAGGSRGKSKRSLQCLVVAAAVVLSGCHYTEEQKWEQCCNTILVDDERSNTPAAKKIIDLQRASYFNGVGESSESRNDASDETTKLRRLRSAVGKYVADNPQARPRDYFVSLGMTCTPATKVAGDVAACEIELPVWVECFSQNIYFPGGPPVPQELQKPIAAMLYWRVDLSDSTVLDNFTRLSPVPGGRLCHR